MDLAIPSGEQGSSHFSKGETSPVQTIQTPKISIFHLKELKQDPTIKQMKQQMFMIRISVSEGNRLSLQCETKPHQHCFSSPKTYSSEEKIHLQT